MATDSWGHREDVSHLGNAFAVFQAISHDSQRQRLGALDGGFACVAVGQNSGKFRHFSDPTAICFSFNFNLQHLNLTQKSTVAHFPPSIDLSTASSTATHWAPSWKHGAHDLSFAMHCTRSAAAFEKVWS
jgi:hypothetical protein